MLEKKLYRSGTFIGNLGLPKSSKLQFLEITNPEFHPRIKHIDISAHYIRELIEDQVVKLQYRSTEQMLADCLTKPLKATQHQRNVQHIGIQEWN
jgi:hypothetical protein